MGCIYVKSNVLFNRIAPGGFMLLWAWQQIAIEMDIDLVITSACDGKHSGPNDPHPLGKAYDVRSHDFTPIIKERIVAKMTDKLGPLFYVFLEDPGGDDEHFHSQVAKGKEFPEPTGSNSSGTSGAKSPV